MKRLFGIAVLLLLLVPRIRAGGADDQYVQIYNLIQQGDTAGTNHPKEALANYTEAQNSLLQFQKAYPGWNVKVVNFRLNYLASKITIVSAALAANSNAPVANMPGSNAPVAAATPPVLINPTPAPQPPSPPVVTAPVVQHPPVAPPTVKPPVTQPAPVVTAPVAPVPAAPAPVVAPPPPVSPNVELLRQIADLQNQLRQVQND